MCYENFDILEVALKCGIRFHSYRRNNIELKALCPFCGDTKYHLGINREKGMFHCFRCGERGNSISLYAKIFGVSNKDAYDSLKGKDEFLEKQIYFTREKEEIPMRSLQDRHDVYYDFLKLLRITKEHRENLSKRGLSDSNMHQFMYRSVPTDDAFRREVLDKLSSKYNLAGIPGFYIDQYGKVQMYLNQYGGMFIPVCNHEGYIQGLQIRLDVPANSEIKKFRWFSSKNFTEGTGAKPWIHVVGDTTQKEACLTEGPMKADVSSILSDGKLFIAVPGVNAIEYLPQVIKELHINKIYEAFDMDKRSRPLVKQALINLHNQLDEVGVKWQSCSWNPMYKGMDEYLYAKGQHNQSELLVA